MAWAGDLVSEVSKNKKFSSNREESLRLLLDLSLQDLNLEVHSGVVLNFFIMG